MIPALLDTLTFVFIVGGLALLWLNLRSSRFASIRISHSENSVAPTSSGSARVTLSEIPDPETCRAHAEGCLEQAHRSTNEIDKETWLRSGARWFELSQATAQRRSGAGPALARNSDAA